MCNIVSKGPKIPEQEAAIFLHLLQWLLATGLLPQSVQSLASSQLDLEAPRSVPNGFYTSLLHTRARERQGIRQHQRG